MKRGTTPTLEIKLELNATDVTEVYFTFKEKVEDSDEFLLQKNYPEDATYDDEKEVFLLPLTQEDTLALKDTFFLEAEVVIGGKSVIKSDIGKEIMQPTLYTEVIEGNESNGESDVISLSFTDYVEGGGSGGTTNYNELSNKPRFNNKEWVGNKTDSDMGIATKGELQTKADKNDTYTKEETNTFLNAKADKDTTYTKTETDNLLNNKQNVISGGNGIKKENDEISVDLSSDHSQLLKFWNGQLLLQVFDVAYNTDVRTNLTVGANNPLASKQYVDNLITTSLKYLVVQTLPTEDIDTHTIYLVPKSTSQTNNIYDEYLYVNNQWELIGTTEVDLSNYYTKTESDNKYQIILTNGNGIEISSGVISAKISQNPSNLISFDSDDNGIELFGSDIAQNDSVRYGLLQTYQDGYNIQARIDSSHKLDADNVDDTNSSNKFVSAQEKQTWNAKADTSDIPTNVSELTNDSGYQTSSDVALAIIDKEDKTDITTDTSSTTVTLTLADNHEYRYTQELTSLTLTMPSGDFISSIVFASGSTPTSMTYDSNIKWSGDDISNGQFVPSASKDYDICLYYNGLNINGIVRGV